MSGRPLIRILTLLAGAMALVPAHGEIERSKPRQITNFNRVEDYAKTRPLPYKFRRQEVKFDSPEPAGTIIIETRKRFLYYVMGNGKAIRYGVGVGREGFKWSGTERISRKAEWPKWTPPPAMREREPDLPDFVEGGPGNPLGARALYLGSSEYRIHGTHQPWTIGRAVSSGCIRMTNEDVIELYELSRIGAKVIVR
jgi:lipoprotein-anchoring transpeptidase ErfK/SrfK